MTGVSISVVATSRLCLFYYSFVRYILVLFGVVIAIYLGLEEISSKK